MKAGRTRDLLPACLFLGPNFIGFCAFVAFPVIFSVVMAFTNWDLTLHNRFRGESIKWIWLQNFHEMFTSEEFWKYLGNTLFLMMGIPIGIAGSLFLAVMLTRQLRSDDRKARMGLAVLSVLLLSLSGIIVWSLTGWLLGLILCLVSGMILALGFATGSVAYRTFFYLPHFTSGVAVYLLWKQMYNPLRGPVNASLQPVLDGLAWLVRSLGHTPWQIAGVGLWAFGAIAVVWLACRIVQSLHSDDIGWGSGLLGMVAIGVAGLVLLGLGVVFRRLPGWATDGLVAPDWLSNVDWAKPSIMIMGLWMAVGSNNMLLYIAGISNIPPELYEAAEVDGAGGWARLWHVTWPQLAPTTFFIVIMSFIGGLQGGFEVARTMTGGGPFGATKTLAYYVYEQGFETGRLGYASAIAWVMFAMIFTLTVFNYRFGSRYINE